MTKKTGLSSDDLQMMDLGQVLDYITEFVNQESKSQEQSSTTKATQADFNNF